MEDSADARVFYRLINAEIPEERDFWTQKQLGVPLRNPSPSAIRSWERGVSVFIDLDVMIEVATTINRGRSRNGKSPLRFIVRLKIPTTSSLVLERSEKSWAHYDIMDASPHELLQCVRLPVIRLEEGR